MVPPLVTAFPFARSRLLSRSRAPPRTSNTRERCCASIMAPEPSDTSSKSTDATAMATPPSERCVPDGRKRERELNG
eukprot:7388080-Prymnesium_polylepis.1